jgi:microsomal dipeptidase-like Zn-dependent dipeptidase
MRRSVLSVLAALVCCLSLVGVGATAADTSSWWDPPNRPSPDSQINVTGAPFTGTDADGDVRGFLEAHNHVFANEGFGGRMICGKVFDAAGIQQALMDCPEHYPHGIGAIFEHATGGDDGTHDPVGYPTFAHWPKHDSLSHQQNYYAWMERAWRGGVRIMVNDLVTNGLICSILPRDRGCNEMDAIRLQAQKSRDLEAYIDTMYGGPGKGWLRIVTTPQQARSVIEQGKMAMVLGVEMSEPFGCKMVLDVPQCNRADIDRGLDEFQRLGISSTFLCHKFDNALCGVRFDTGTTGVAVNAGQFLSTGTFWHTERCRGPQADNPISSADLTGALADLFPADPPAYDTTKRCNTRGLTGLGEYALRGLMARGMMLEVDHMSVKAAGRALDILDSAGYPGVVSSHSWMDPSWHERVYERGGLIAQYGHRADEFVADWQSEQALRARYGKAYAFGTDMNGVGGTPAPRHGNVTYPFTSFDGGSVLQRQTTGQRTWDVNTDGVAHYGLVPDWIEDIRLVGGQDVVDSLAGGAQMYLDTWNATRAWRAAPNLARGKAASASTTEWTLFGSLKPPKAVDGDTASRWASEWKDNQWFRVDLGSAQAVGKVTVRWEAAHAKDYDVQVSTDGSTWRTVGQVRGSDGGLDTVAFTPTTARHVRLSLLARATSYGFSLHELEVY